MDVDYMTDRGRIVTRPPRKCFFRCSECGDFTSNIQAKHSLYNHEKVICVACESEMRLLDQDTSTGYDGKEISLDGHDSMEGV